MSRRVSAQQRAYEHLKERLVMGGLDGGEFLTESVIAEELGISRTPVREALFRLEVEHLVTLVPGRGAFIPHVTERAIRELIEVRDLIECHAITKIGSPVSAALLAKLDEHIDEQRLLDQAPVDFIRQDRSFHQTIVDASGNALLSGVYAGMSDQQTRMGVRAVTDHADRFESVLKEHRDIVEGLRGGDLSQAVKAVRVHLESSLQVLLDPGRP